MKGRFDIGERSLMINQCEKKLHEMLAHNQLKKTYNERFDNGSNVTISISLDIKNFDSKDTMEILSYIAKCSRNFYLYVAAQYNNKP